jgi:hypothetical protein
MSSESLPEAITRAVQRLRNAGSNTVDDAMLWLDASWRAAVREGISTEEYIRWMELGLWNLAGDPEVLKRVGMFRLVAGEKGWMLAKANLDPEECVFQFYEKGNADLLESAEVVVALTQMADAFPIESEPDQGPAHTSPSEHGPLNFG